MTICFFQAMVGLLVHKSKPDAKEKQVPFTIINLPDYILTFDF